MVTCGVCFIFCFIGDHWFGLNCWRMRFVAIMLLPNVKYFCCLLLSVVVFVCLLFVSFVFVSFFVLPAIFFLLLVCLDGMLLSVYDMSALFDIDNVLAHSLFDLLLLSW